MNTNAIWDLDRTIAEALDGARLSQERVDQIAEALRVWQRSLSWSRASAKQVSQEVRDLRIHLKDRDNHIRNLEAQLRPYIVDTPAAVGNQEAIL